MAAARDAEPHDGAPTRIRFVLGDRAATVTRGEGGWSFEGRTFDDLSALGRELMAALGAEARYGLVIRVDGTGCSGRIVDGGGPRASYVVYVDVDVPSCSSASSAATLEETVGVFIRRLEEEPPPDSVW